MGNYKKRTTAVAFTMLATLALSSPAMAGKRDRPSRSTTVTTTTQTTHSTTVTTTRSHGASARPSGGYHRPEPSARPAHAHPAEARPTVVRPAHVRPAPPTRTVVVSSPPRVVVEVQPAHYSGHRHHHHYDGCGCPGYEVEVRRYHHHYYEPPAPRREVIVEKHYRHGHSGDEVVAGACLGAGIGALFGLALAH